MTIPSTKMKLFVFDMTVTVGELYGDRLQGARSHGYDKVKIASYRYHPERICVLSSSICELAIK
jgi:hypothetical protein